MPEPRFRSLRLELQQGGVSPRYIRRTIGELKDHYADIERAAVDAGASRAEAASVARAALGSERAIASAVLSQPGLKSWAYRWPRTAHALRSTASVAVLPAVPVVYCLYHGPAIARWGASISLAALITSGLLFGMQSMLVYP